MITDNTRQVKKGSIFYALPSASQRDEGEEAIARRCRDAQSAGAREIIAEIARPEQITIPFTQVPSVRRALAEAATAQAGAPARHMLCVGVTGTSGKTTTAFLVESILREAGHTVGLIGTVLCRYPGFEQESTHTTPGPIELQALLARMLSAGCTAVVMEVSSHAIAQHRVDGVYFDAVAFTNLSPEHLDYHADMDEYFATKARLFFELSGQAETEGGKSPRAVICVEESWGQRLADQWTTSRGAETLMRVRAVDLHPVVTASGITGQWSGAPLRSALTGEFNVSNIAVALGIARALAIPAAHAVAGVARLAGVPGRMERVSAPDCPVTVLVDYAHKPDALQKVLHSVRRTTQRLTVVFGCGGDRDRSKRSVMGRIAAAGADRVVITSDNPRTENPQSIIDEILAGAHSVEGGSAKTAVQSDRARAIADTVATAVAGEMVVIAGKGHETYQIIGQTKTPFDDREIARAALRARGFS